MGNLFGRLILSVAVALVFSGAAVAQERAPGPGWLPPAARVSPETERAARLKYKLDEPKLDPHDLSGVWKGTFSLRDAPPFTAYGKQLSDYIQPEITDAGFQIESATDPAQICDPMGFPRLPDGYGFEFVQLPNRLFQFFERTHTWRTIWTDGRKLPPDPPQPRFLGYAVGRWEGDTLIIESNGFEDRTWIGKGGTRGGVSIGYPHSDEMRTVERYRRTAVDTLEMELTIYDSKVYTAPWTSSTGTATLYPGSEIGEYYCVPSDERDFQNLVSRPAAGAEQLK